MKLIAVMVALASAGLMACSNDVRVSDCNGSFTYSGFDEADSAKVEHAGVRWTAFTGQPISIEPGPPGLRCHIAAAEKIPDIDGKPVVGLHEYPVHLITLIAGHPELESILLHELGHAYGLKHRDDGEIMYPDLIENADFNDADREECERVGVCYGSPAASPM